MPRGQARSLQTPCAPLFSKQFVHSLWYAKATNKSFNLQQTHVSFQDTEIFPSVKVKSN